MKLPEKLKILGHEFKVIAPYQFKETGDQLGQCDLGLHEIRITSFDGMGNHRPESAIAETLLHEIIEAVDWLTHQEVFKNKHDALSAFSEALFQVLSDNNLFFGTKFGASQISFSPGITDPSTGEIRSLRGVGRPYYSGADPSGYYFEDYDDDANFGPFPTDLEATIAYNKYKASKE